jgi:hypothetical protein
MGRWYSACKCLRNIIFIHLDTDSHTVYIFLD